MGFSTEKFYEIFDLKPNYLTAYYYNDGDGISATPYLKLPCLCFKFPYLIKVIKEDEYLDILLKFLYLHKIF
jgi:hypothetical protein